ncbi:MAG: translation factor GTPase family protein [Candidatus Latescibacterota bacterium]|nr:translation factor GTPase family protein [Candidatus Latescibacterota bacterium]
MSTAHTIRNIGILAHVDAGKTTLTEHMLYLSGSTRAAGSVDKGTSLSDVLDVEKKRGISVRSAALSFTWRDAQINLIDTPGHVDFSAEVERALRVLDGAVLVLSAVEGIQAQSEPIWSALKAMNIPTLVFINKVDRMGADWAAVVAALQNEFSTDVLPVDSVQNEGDNAAVLVDGWADPTPALVERIAEVDDALLEAYLEGQMPSVEALRAALAAATRCRALFPVLLGSAKNALGTDRLLDAIVDYLPPAGRDRQGPESAVVFRIDHDEKVGRIAGVRVFRGCLKPRDSVWNATAEREEKITQVKRSLLNKLEDAPRVEAGDIGFLCGLPEVKIGDVLGDPEPVPETYALSEPLLSVQVNARDEAQHAALAAALQQLASEDPHLDFCWYPEERELHLRIMGVIQTEIVTEVLRTRFDIEADFSAPTVVYKETPASSGHGAESYTMPKPCWAIVRYLIEPGAPGSGIVYASEVSVDEVKLKYQREIEGHIKQSFKQGIKGWEVTDLKVTLVDGSDHVLHSRPGNFILATNIAVLKGLQETETILLEPMLAYRIGAPQEHVGKVTSDIIEMRGTFEPAELADGHFVLRGRLPLATSMDYTIRLGALTAGRAKLSLRFDGYDPCPPGEGVVRSYKGICPLDRAKYILKMRGAITEATSR